MGHRTEPRDHITPPMGCSLAKRRGGRNLHLVLSRRDVLSLCGVPVSVTYDAVAMAGRLCAECNRLKPRTRINRR